MHAQLAGTKTQPAVELHFDVNTTHPKDGTPILDWVRDQPARSWNPTHKIWHVSAFHGHPETDLAAAGFTIAADTLNGATFDDVYHPLADADSPTSNKLRVWPRLVGYQRSRALLPDSARWVKGEGHWQIPADMLPATGIDATDTARHAAAHAANTRARTADGARQLARASSLDGHEHTAATIGQIPDWFAVTLDGHQLAGAAAICAGHTLVCDDMGLGKTFTALAAAALAQTERIVVVCPPGMEHTWADAAATAGFDTPCVIVAARKQPPLPEHGIVVVADSLLAARDQLADELAAWRANMLIADEAHRHKNGRSSRAKAVTTLAATADTAVAMTGTPLLTDPLELLGPLRITGHLDRTFGGWHQFSQTYFTVDRWGAYRRRDDQMGHLRQQLDDHVWVRRLKTDTLDLPDKTRQFQTVQSSAAQLDQAHRPVHDMIDEWLDTLDTPPSTRAAHDWAAQQPGAISKLRMAAGLAKIDAATTWIARWVDEHTVPDRDLNPVYSRPLVVWCHHHQVADALSSAVPNAVGTAGVITGQTPRARRRQLIAAFQAGNVPVLVCSIHAVGTGVTLTASADALFVETDWTPALLTQAEDRIHRRGTTRPVTVTTLVADGTLDAYTHGRVLRRKIGVLGKVTPGADVQVAADPEDVAVPVRMLAEMIAKRAAERFTEPTVRPAAS